jgi:hypothetical protein
MYKQLLTPDALAPLTKLIAAITALAHSALQFRVSCHRSAMGNATVYKRQAPASDVGLGELCMAATVTDIFGST